MAEGEVAKHGLGVRQPQRPRSGGILTSIWISSEMHARRTASWSNGSSTKLGIPGFQSAPGFAFGIWKSTGAAGFVTKQGVRSEILKDITRIVVKLGTGVLTDSRKQPDLPQMEQLVAQVAEQRQAGREIVLVSSGAVGAGMGVLGFDKRPSDLAELQACAAVGQSRLMAIYEKLFDAHGLSVAQILLTHDDLEHHERHLNARNTLVTLMKHGVVPIINENDVVSFTELKFGDNDKLSALVASLLPADLLIVLTTVDGVLENFGKANP